MCARTRTGAHTGPCACCAPARERQREQEEVGARQTGGGGGLVKWKWGGKAGDSRMKNGKSISSFLFGLGWLFGSERLALETTPGLFYRLAGGFAPRRPQFGFSLKTHFVYKLISAHEDKW